MPSVVIKPDRDRDRYVVWSTVTESPHGYGTRDQVVELLRDGIRRSSEDPADPYSPLDRADRNGSSAMGGWTEGHWDDDFFIYMQAGVLRRKDLWTAAVWLCEGRDRDVLDLLEPLEDDGDGFSGTERLKEVKACTVNQPGSGSPWAEDQIALAEAAVEAFRSEVEGWNR